MDPVLRLPGTNQPMELQEITDLKSQLVSAFNDELTAVGPPTGHLSVSAIPAIPG
jgi:hypothetical protein